MKKKMETHWCRRRRRWMDAGEGGGGGGGSAMDGDGGPDLDQIRDLGRISWWIRDLGRLSWWMMKGVGYGGAPAVVERRWSAGDGGEEEGDGGGEEGLFLKP